MNNLKPGSKVVIFSATMVALANILSALSIGLTRIGQVGFDISHIATFIGAIYGGPTVSFLVGLLGGIVPGINFGPLGGLGWLGLLGLPLGKSLTGFTTGVLCRFFRLNERPNASLLTILVVLLGYIPECIFTVFFFLVVVPYFLGSIGWLTLGVLIVILVKAWIEIAMMSAFMTALSGNAGFRNFVNGLTGHGSP
ncbi:MAG: hypothetical protein V1857_05105 [archaeon]